MRIEWDDIPGELLREMPFAELQALQRGMTAAEQPGTPEHGRWMAGERYEMWLAEWAAMRIYTRLYGQLRLDRLLREVAAENGERGRPFVPDTQNRQATVAMLARRGWICRQGRGWYVTERGGEHLEAIARRPVDPALLGNGEVPE